MPQSTFALVHKRVGASLIRFRDDERGSMALVMVFMFLIMVMFGGIAVDVMRFETRRVTLQQTLDRAALAAASLQQGRTPQAIVDDWFAKSGILDDGMSFVEFSAATVGGQVDEGLRRVTVDATVFSQNFFMSWYSDRDYFETQLRTEAAQGVSQIEVMLVLDITGSMAGTKIAGLRDAATSFVDLVKANDSENGVSIGMVPYAAQINIPANLRQQFNAQNVSSWDNVANAGVPWINCMEIPTSTYGQTALSLLNPIRMAAVADANMGTTATANFVAPFAPNPRTRACTTISDNPATVHNESTNNHLMLPTKDGDAVKARVSRLAADGNTNIAMGMRWAVAMIDEAARPIYTAIGDPSVLGRPANNDSVQTRKIIILMTDGDHVTNTHILDAFKTGPSPIWRGTDGNFAIRFAPGGPALTNGTRPTNCSNWNIPASANRFFFVPHLKDDSERLRVGGGELEGRGTGTNTTMTNTTCDPNSWFANPTWPQTTDVRDSHGERTVVMSGGNPVMVTATQLDWSEVWRWVPVSWVARQLYMRSAVTGTGNYTTIMNQFRGTYLSSDTNMDALLQTNCTAAKAAGIEVYGIAFQAPTQGTAAINGCASLPKSSYFYDAANNADLMAAFAQIATDISDLRLTQ